MSGIVKVNLEPSWVIWRHLTGQPGKVFWSTRHVTRALLLVWLPNRVSALTLAALRQHIVQASSAQALAERKARRFQAELLLAVSQLEEFEPGTSL